MNLDNQAERLGFSLIRVSAYVRRTPLRRRIEELAFELVESIATRDLQRFSDVAAALASVVRLGKGIYEIEPMNADMIIAEFGNIGVGMRQIAELSAQDVRNSSLTSPFDQTLWRSVGAQIEKRDSEKSNVEPLSKGQESAKPAEVKKKRQVPILDKSIQKEDRAELGQPELDNPAIRQSAITDRIRQFGNKSVQLKDIIGEFPGFSERTIRYDLERLCNLGIIERIGQGGPKTHYRARVIE